MVMTNTLRAPTVVIPSTVSKTEPKINVGDWKERVLRNGDVVVLDCTAAGRYQVRRVDRSLEGEQDMLISISTHLDQNEALLTFRSFT